MIWDAWVRGFGRGEGFGDVQKVSLPTEDEDNHGKFLLRKVVGGLGRSVGSSGLSNYRLRN